MIRLKGYSTRRRDKRVCRYAREHVGKNVAACPDLVVVKEIGPRPATSGDAEYERLCLASLPDERRPAWKREQEVVEKQLATLPNRWALRAGIGVLIGAEWYAAVELLTNEGFQPPVVYVLGLATACILSYLMFIASKEIA